MKLMDTLKGIARNLPINGEKEKVLGDPVLAPISNENVLLITAYIKKGIVTVSHKTEVRKAMFGDNMLVHMMKDHKNRKQSIEMFVQALGQLILGLSDPHGIAAKAYEDDSRREREELLQEAREKLAINN